MKKIFLLLVSIMILSLGFMGTSFAAEGNNQLGYVNVKYVLQNYPGMNTILQEINTEKARLQKEFSTQSKDMNATDKNKLGQQFNQTMAQYEQQKLGPVQKSVRDTIAKVAKAKGITNVVDSGVMLFGGKDLTKDILNSLKK